MSSKVFEVEEQTFNKSDLQSWMSRCIEQILYQRETSKIHLVYKQT